MRKSFVSGLCVLLSTFTACDQPIRNRERGALLGGALGAGLGAIVGNQVGHSGTGVAIGSGFGALTGGVVGHSFDRSEDAAWHQEERLRRNEAELRRQRRELEAVRAGADRGYGRPAGYGRQRGARPYSRY